MNRPDAGNPPDLRAVAAQVKELARGLEFDLVGIASAAASSRAEFVREWIAAGRGGEMSYLEDRLEERIDPSLLLPGAKTAVCVAMNYHVPLDEEAELDTGTNSCATEQENGESVTGRIARYALGRDYHELIKPKLYAIADWLRERVPGARTKCGVDTAPIAERELAARAGVGWVGKNTCVINSNIGSWLFLGSVLTTIDLPIDLPAVDRCGTCTRCIDACPTAAITPYKLDARRCISYLTIEHQGEIDSELQDKMGDWLFGCDICQEVCPWNGRAPITGPAELQPRIAGGRLSIDAVLSWQKTDFNRTFRGTAVKRIRLPILQRNARIVQQNQKRQAHE